MAELPAGRSPRSRARDWLLPPSGWLSTAGPIRPYDRRCLRQLAGPRATAALLGALPAVGVLLGTGLGAAPLDVLLRTSWGLGCLVLGSLLTIAGVAWTERIARAAEEAT